MHLDANLDANLDASRFVSLSVSELFPNPHKQLLSDYKMVSHLVSFPYPPQKRSPVLRSNIMNTIPSDDNSNRLPEITTTETHSPESNSDDKQSIAIEKSIGKSSKNLVRKYSTDKSESEKDDGPKIKKSYKRKTSEHIFWPFGIGCSITRAERRRDNKRVSTVSLNFLIKDIIERKGKQTLVEWLPSWVLTRDLEESFLEGGSASDEDDKLLERKEV